MFSFLKRFILNSNDLSKNLEVLSRANTPQKITLDYFKNEKIPSNFTKISCEFKDNYNIFTKHIELDDNEHYLYDCVVFLCDGVDGLFNIKLTVLDKDGRSASSSTNNSLEELTDDWAYGTGFSLSAKVGLHIRELISNPFFFPTEAKELLIDYDSLGERIYTMSEEEFNIWYDKLDKYVPRTYGKVWPHLEFIREHRKNL
jgi:hypothetical protein